ncbi:hypothetical protein AOQ84DRAFT_222459 [Glonium stellatum]|uniref:NACHT domain-containing protein n=1 Tax=Glonium stellatum TaxID=574774 RepID=A0A8E2JSH7_9PEZI|nr:hypothetical protein AOQ84DRAFT_222459 [Glonium stellatum]
MDPLSALGLASNIVQLVQFVGVVISDSHELYSSIDGALQRNSALEEVARNLVEMNSEIMRTQKSLPNLLHLSPGERQLKSLCDECDSVSKELCTKLNALKVSGRARYKKWDSFRLALKSMWNEGEVRSLEKRLEGIRTRLNTSLLICLRDHLNDPLSRNAQDQKDMEPFMKEIKKQHKEMLNAIKRKDQEVSDPEHMAQFSAKVDASTELFKESRFCSFILSQLKFEEMPNRHEAIPEAHRKTFNWLFESPYTPQTSSPAQDPSVTEAPTANQASAAAQSALPNQGPATTQDKSKAKTLAQSPVTAESPTTAQILRTAQNLAASQNQAAPLDVNAALPDTGTAPPDEGTAPELTPPSPSWDNFVEWLEGSDGRNIYWITGKAGSGKSTLMKYLYNDPRTIKYLKAWAGKMDFTIAGFFFWCAGTNMEMSQMGLLQSLLHQVLQKYPKLITRFFSQRWDSYYWIRGGLHDLSEKELTNVFKKLISDDSLRVAFFIDGLDEFNGNHEDLVQLIISSKSPNVKFCCASRPWLVFEDAFEGRPSLMLERLTQGDITRFVVDKFEQNKRYAKLKIQQPDLSSKLVNEVVEKANGVFLWVYLVVKSLLEGLRDSDRVRDLQRRLDSLPSDLEELFDRLLNRLDQKYFKHACQLIRIVRAVTVPLTVLVMSFADEYNTKSALRVKVKALTKSDITYREDEMRRRLNSRSKGLIEVSDSKKVQFLHRTVKDFIDAPRNWTKIVKEAGFSFDPIMKLCSAYLFKIKTVNPDRPDRWQDALKALIEYAIQIQENRGTAPIAILDEADRVTEQITTQHYNPVSRVLKHRFKKLGKSTNSFLEYTISRGLFSYAMQKINEEGSSYSKRTLNRLLYVAGRQEGKAPISKEIMKALLKLGAEPKSIEHSQYTKMHPEAQKMLKSQLRLKVHFKDFWHI